MKQDRTAIKPIEANMRGESSEERSLKNDKSKQMLVERSKKQTIKETIENDGRKDESKERKPRTA